MEKVAVYNLSCKKVGEMELDESVFGAPVKEHLLHEVVRMQLNSRRKGTASTKERAAVSGGGKKPYRQKGTGRARQGTDRAPHFVGGGTVHGPRPRSYAFKPPKKVKKGALQSALSWVLKNGRMRVLDHFKLDQVKTKDVSSILSKFGVESALIVDHHSNTNLKLSIRNMQDHLFLPPEGVNVFDILRHHHLLITTNAVVSLQARLQN